MVKDTRRQQDTKAPGHFGNQGPSHRRPAGEGLEERHQRTRDQAPSDVDGEMTARSHGREDLPEGLQETPGGQAKDLDPKLDNLGGSLAANRSQQDTKTKAKSGQGDKGERAREPVGKEAAKRR
jgi:hypothetical protein